MLFKVTNEENYNSLIKYLKSYGYIFAEKDISYKEAKELYFKDNRRTILINAYYNSTLDRFELQLTYLSLYNHNHENKGTMKRAKYNTTIVLNKINGGNDNDKN